MGVNESVTRAVVFTLDPSPAEERLLRSYCGAARMAYNWAVREVAANLAVRKAQREEGIQEDQLAPALSWSAWSLSKRWNSVKELEAPWWREVSMHAFRSGITAAADAFKNWDDSRTGKREGRRIGFPKFKSKRNTPLSVSFVEINHQLSWLAPDRHHVRLMLPQSCRDPEFRRRRQHLSWLHTVESTTRLYGLLEEGLTTIQKVTISLRGGRWRVSFQIRYTPSSVRSAIPRASLVGVDLGLRHLATLSEPVRGLTDNEGHIPNPTVLEKHVRRLQKLDRHLARAEPDSNARSTLVRRRRRLYGRTVETRALYLHRVTTALALRFDVVAIEDLNVAGMSCRKRHLGRRLADTGLGELRRQLTYKTADQGKLVAVDRFYPSSKTCSSCGVVKAKLPLWERVFTCDNCGAVSDRDVNAARNIAQEAMRLLARTSNDKHLQRQQYGAGLRPEPANAFPRPHKTDDARAEPAGSPEGGTKTPSPQKVPA
jgi:putative transposase